MNVDRNEKIWSYSNTGTRMHAFVQTSRLGYVRAMCRSSIEVPDTFTMVGKDEAYLKCSRCTKLAVAMWDRAEASLAPVDTDENPAASQDYYEAQEAVAEGESVEVCGEQMYDPFRGLGACVKHKNHSRVTSGAEHEGDFDQRVDQHAEALAMNAEETAKAVVVTTETSCYRTEDDVTRVVSRKSVLAELGHAQMGDSHEVLAMSCTIRTDYTIEYRDGRRVRIELIEEMRNDPSQP